jgi:hypothetical protein
MKTDSVARSVVLVALGFLVLPSGHAVEPAPRRYQGKVVDARTGLPIQSFRLLPGLEWDSTDGRHILWWDERNEAEFADGRFDHTFAKAHKDTSLLRVCIRAPGYLPARSDAQAHGKGDQQFTLRLEPLPEPKGIVLLPDGTPAAGAKVLIAVEGYCVRFSGGALKGVFHHMKERPLPDSERTTDERGRFAFERQTLAYMLVAVHEKGYLETTAAKLAKSSTLRLQPWGRLEAQLFVLGRPAPRRKLSLQSPRSVDPSLLGTGWYESGTSVRHDAWGLETDDEGRAVLGRVAPGPMAVHLLTEDGKRLLVTLHSYKAPLDIEGGKTLRVHLGKANCTLTGRLRAAPDSGLVIDPRNVRVSVFLKPPKISGFGRIVQEEYAAYNAFRRSEEGRAYSHEVSGIEADGSFRIERVLPGSHVIQVRVHDGPVREGKEPGALAGWFVKRFTADIEPVVLDEGGAVPKDAPPTLDLGVLSVRKTEKKKPPPRPANF